MDQAVYDRYVGGVDEYHWWHAARRTILVDLIDRTIAMPRPAKILDVGCGTGLEIELLQRYGEVWGVDVERRMIDACRRRGLRNVDVARAERLAFDDETFDLITCLDTIEHIDDDRAVMRELSRIGKPGSHVCMTVPAGPALFGPFDKLAGHYRRYSRRSLAALLTGAGYSIVRLSYYNSVFYLPIAALRLATRHGSVRMDQARTLNPPARPINALMQRVFASERWWLRFVNAPFGLSLFAIARNDRNPGDR
jgi:SAM-dependent methyltransferase